MPSPNPTTLAVLAFLPLIAWRMVVRYRRMTTRQRLGRIRPWITVIVFPLLLWLIAMTAFVPPHPQPEKLPWLGAGLLVGVLLSVYGLRRTTFEVTSEGLFYTPHAKLGIAISVLFTLRVLWRIGELLLRGPVPPDHMNDFTLSPFTLAPLGLLGGYYIAYSAGLIAWRWRHFARLRRQAA